MHHWLSQGELLRINVETAIYLDLWQSHWKSEQHLILCSAAQPKAVMWPWHQRRMALARNDFFQFGRPDSLALGGAPQYALYLDGDLQFGSSGPSDTFGSPCLASGVEFEVGRVELWGLV